MSFKTYTLYFFIIFKQPHTQPFDGGPQSFTVGEFLLPFSSNFFYESEWTAVMSASEPHEVETWFATESKGKSETSKAVWFCLF